METILNFPDEKPRKLENLIDLPEEVLVKILSFLPNRMDFSPVCKKFYELICYIDRFKYKMIVGAARHELVDKAWIAKTYRVFDTVDVFLKFESSDELDLLKEVFRIHGEKVKNLEWSNWSEFSLNQDDFVGWFNLMPNLEELELSSWKIEFSKAERSTEKFLNLNKLKKLKLSGNDNFIVEFLVKHLPKNIIEQLKIDQVTQEPMPSFIQNQQSINHLHIEGSECFDASVFQSLNLIHLRCILREGETPLNQRDFLKALIQYQPELESLDTLSEYDFDYCFVDDEVFQEISKCRNLKSLKMNFDGLSSNAISHIQNLKKLESFELKTQRESSLEVFEELSLLKLPLKSLILHLWGFEIPAKTYRQFGENLNLTSLKIILGTWHQVNFFIESFPTLESLSIRFGEANKPVELSQVSTEDLKIHNKMKSLDLNFWGSKETSFEMLLKLSSSFPNLEKLNITSRFPFTVEFFESINCNFDRIKSFNLSSFPMVDEEAFSPELFEALKNISKKFDNCCFQLHYADRGRMERLKSVEKKRPFTYETLTTALKDHFMMKEHAYCNNRVHRHLTLKAGFES